MFYLCIYLNVADGDQSKVSGKFAKLQCAPKRRQKNGQTFHAVLLPSSTIRINEFSVRNKKHKLILQQLYKAKLVLCHLYD